jgi:hypothetical protein
MEYFAEQTIKRRLKYCPRSEATDAATPCYALAIKMIAKARIGIIRLIKFRN